MIWTVESIRASKPIFEIMVDGRATVGRIASIDAKVCTIKFDLNGERDTVRVPTTKVIGALVKGEPIYV